MAPSSRSAQFTKLHKILKKHYRPVAVDPERPVLEHLLFACCLENARHAAAEEAFAAMVEAFFDWNEIRVSSVRELAEVMARLPDPPAAAGRLKRVLQHVFEESYSFDLEDLRKKNLGPAIDALKKIDGTTPFSVAYVVQAALGGHAIPLDAGSLEVMRILSLATDEDVAGGEVPGLERAIAKSSGVEFASLLQQLGVDFAENPFAPDLREKLLEIDPEAKSRLPKRGARKKTAAEEPAPAPDATAAVEVKAADAEAAEVSDKAKRKAAAKKPATKKNPPEEKTPPAKKNRAADADPHDESGTKKAPSARLSKRKPR
jgi:endonuclease-3